MIGRAIVPNGSARGASGGDLDFSVWSVEPLSPMARRDAQAAASYGCFVLQATVV
jgi:hypothetical protein